MNKRSALIALGANQPSEAGAPRETLEAALRLLEARGVRVAARSRWRRTPAYPPGAGPEFVNGAARLETELSPTELLDVLHAVESELGRERRKRWAPRVCDLDLIAFADAVAPDAAEVEAIMALGPEEAGLAPAPNQLVLPHPRMQERAFVLAPLCDVAPDWRHPITGVTAAEMLAALPEKERMEIEIIDD